MTADVELFWLFSYGSGTEKLRLMTMTSGQYLKSGSTNDYGRRRSEALKWIYQNCRGEYTILWTKPPRGPVYAHPNVRAYHCEFADDHKAIEFKLIFNDFLQEAAKHESRDLF